MTESMPIASNPRHVAGKEQSECKLRSVGMSGGPEVVVLRNPPWNNSHCNVDEEGHICVKGDCVTKGYEVRPHMTETGEVGKGEVINPNIEGFTHGIDSDGNGVGYLCTGDKVRSFLDTSVNLTWLVCAGIYRCRRVLDSIWSLQRNHLSRGRKDLSF